MIGKEVSMKKEKLEFLAVGLLGVFIGISVSFLTTLAFLFWLSLINLIYLGVRYFCGFPAPKKDIGMRITFSDFGAYIKWKLKK